MINRNYCWIVVVLNILLIWSCTSEPKNTTELEPGQVIGKWEVTEATRSGRPTGTLDDLYFEFLADGTMNTNLPTAEGSSEYQLNGNVLQQRGTVDINYTIESLTESVMILKTELQNLEFRFSLAKTAAAN